MISDRTIICVASNWQLDPTSKHHVMRHLAKRNRVIWVNYHGTRRPTMSASDVRSIWSAIRRITRGAEPIDESMVQVTPFVLPAAGDGLVGRASRRAFVMQVRRVLNQVQGDQPLPVQVWTFAPDVAFLSGQFDEECLVYYCVDEYTEFDGFDETSIARLESDLLNRADVVLTSSQALFENKRRHHSNVHLVRHGVEHEHFARAVARDLPRPAELNQVSGPIVGFFGLIHHWVDVSLIVETAKRLGDVQFVLVGQVFAGASELRGCPNIHLLGRQPYADLPAYCAAFDVAILPFKCNCFTQFINPIKLREYLAAGLPVVSVPIPEARIFEPDVMIAEGVDTFARACREAIANDSLSSRRLRSHSMACEGWQGVVDGLSRIVMGSVSTLPPGGMDGLSGRFGPALGSLPPVHLDSTSDRVVAGSLIP